jgi:hypothetical protein
MIPSATVITPIDLPMSCMNCTPDSMLSSQTNPIAPHNFRRSSLALRKSHSQYGLAAIIRWEQTLWKLRRAFKVQRERNGLFF